jgi:hypothetical protein
MDEELADRKRNGDSAYDEQFDRGRVRSERASSWIDPECL